MDDLLQKMQYNLSFIQLLNNSIEVGKRIASYNNFVGERQTLGFKYKYIQCDFVKLQIYVYKSFYISALYVQTCNSINYNKTTILCWRIQVVYQHYDKI